MNYAKLFFGLTIISCSLLDANPLKFKQTSISIQIPMIEPFDLPQEQSPTISHKSVIFPSQIRDHHKAPAYQKNHLKKEKSLPKEQRFDQAENQKISSGLFNNRNLLIGVSSLTALYCFMFKTRSASTRS